MKLLLNEIYRMKLLPGLGFLILAVALPTHYRPPTLLAEPNFGGLPAIPGNAPHSLVGSVVALAQWSNTNLGTTFTVGTTAEGIPTIDGVPIYEVNLYGSELDDYLPAVNSVDGTAIAFDSNYLIFMNGDMLDPSTGRVKEYLAVMIHELFHHKFLEQFGNLTCDIGGYCQHAWVACETAQALCALAQDQSGADADALKGQANKSGNKSAKYFAKCKCSSLPAGAESQCGAEYSCS